jgi:hypothetical protein
MPKGTTTANQLLALIFNATPMANFADNAASSPNTNLYLSLHTADPTASGNQTSSEAAYTNYARIAVARTVGGWAVVSNAAANAALAQFPQCGVTGATVTHVAIGKASSGTGQILYVGALSSSLAVSNLIQPQFNASTLNVTET